MKLAELLISVISMVFNHIMVKRSKELETRLDDKKKLYEKHTLHEERYCFDLTTIF